MGLVVFSKLFRGQDMADLERPGAPLRGDAARWAQCMTRWLVPRTKPGALLPPKRSELRRALAERSEGLRGA